MSEFRFLHAADIHLDSPLRGLEKYEGAPVDEIREACRRALSGLVDLAIDAEVHFVLIAGDIYDGDWKDYNTGLYFVKQVTRLQNAGISVFAVTGNHDADNRMTRTLHLPQNPNGLPVMLSGRKAETLRLPDIDVAIHGKSFSTARETENLALSYPSAVSGCFNIGMLHTALNGIAGHEPYAPCTVTDLHSRNYDYWALGHIHARRHVHDTGQTPIVFPGNIQGRHIRETGPKGCELVTVNSAGQTEIAFQPLDVFRWEVCDVDATAASSATEIMERSLNGLRALADCADGRPLAVRINIQGATTVHTELASARSQWMQQLRAGSIGLSHDVWIEKVRIRTTPPPAASVGMTDDGPLEELLNLFDEFENDEELLISLRNELKPLEDRLGGLDDFVVGNEPVIPHSAEQLREVLQTVQPLLLHRLSGKEVTP